MDKVSIKQQLADMDVGKYLTIYVADIDWSPILDNLRKLNESKEEKFKRIAFVIGLAACEPGAFRTIDLSNVFNWCFKWQQYNSRDWVEELAEIYVQDKKIDISRAKCLELGIIYPLHYNPITRQAFNWLVGKAEENQFTIESTISREKLKNIVYVYGGKAVCSVFDKPELSTRINKLPHWRSGYFFERLIHDVYSDQQLLEIKTHEINKLKNSGSDLVKYIRKEESNGDIQRSAKAID